jgi:hypothetical protein
LPEVVLVTVPAVDDEEVLMTMVCPVLAWITIELAVVVINFIVAPSEGLAGRVAVKAAVQKYPLTSAAEKFAALSVHVIPDPDPVIVNVFVPGLSVTVTPPEPTTFILPKTSGLTAPPVLPVSVNTLPVPPPPPFKLPSWLII